MAPRTSRLVTLRTIERERVIAIVRFDDGSQVRPVAEALAEGGVRIIEVTMTIRGALDALAALASESSELLVGAGTVLDSETARFAILRGARFVVGPTFRPKVVELCHRYDVAAVPGAFTPTEIVRAWEAGADLVKLFPAGSLGPSYLKELRGPLPDLRLIPTGGVTAENAAEFLGAGAFAVGLGGALVDRDAVVRGEYGRITEHVQRLMRSIRPARGST
jgi:2-dehydro-3-deoxyphosphogluconate aldolase / (4S)-4-hydroxy-2-oxoglutarate aldolase